MRDIIDLADVEHAPGSVMEFFDVFSRRIAWMTTVEERCHLLADMEERFRLYVGKEPWNREAFSEVYGQLKRKCREVVPW